MIKVLINGTPIYRLEFRRRKYKSVQKQTITAGEVIARIKQDGGIGNEVLQVDFASVLASIRAAFERKPLFETTALIFMHDAKKDEPPVATATTRQSKSDDNSKLVGRGQALHKLFNLKHEGTDTLVFSDIERQAIRKAYNNRSKQSSKPLPPAGSAGSTPIAQVRTPAQSTNVVKFERPALTLAA